MVEGLCSVLVPMVGLLCSSVRLDVVIKMLVCMWGGGGGLTLLGPVPVCVQCVCIHLFHCSPCLCREWPKPVQLKATDEDTLGLCLQVWDPRVRCIVGGWMWVLWGFVVWVFLCGYFCVCVGVCRLLCGVCL